jgi:hypothetical protein
VPQDINVIALVKGEERYVFLFNDETRAETLRTLGRYASNPEMSFNWYDAAVLSQKVRRASNLTNEASDRQIDVSDVDFTAFDDVMFDDLLFDD